MSIIDQVFAFIQENADQNMNGEAHVAPALNITPKQARQALNSLHQRKLISRVKRDWYIYVTPEISPTKSRSGWDTKHLAKLRHDIESGDPKRIYPALVELHRRDWIAHPPADWAPWLTILKEASA